MRFIKKDRGIPATISDFYKVEVSGLLTEVEDYKKSLEPGMSRALTNQLKDEQVGLCAYCQSDISKNHTVEHIICQTDSRHYSLSYHNLIAVCFSLAKPQRCDKARSEKRKGYSGNEYFVPVWFMEGCQTIAIDMPNKFFDVEITGNNPRLITGRLVPRADLEDYWKNEVARIIEGLNLNQEALKNARKDTFHNAVLTVKNKGAKSWEHVFEYYNSKPRAYQEFILLSIAKQV